MSDTQFNNLKLWLTAKFEFNEKQHQEITDHLVKLNGGQLKNTEHRLRIEGGWMLFKVLFATSIISNILVVIKLFILDR